MKLAALFVFAEAISHIQGYVRVCYFTNWSRWRPSSGHFTVGNVDPHLCTHLIYAFGDFDSQGNLKPHENENEFTIYEEFNRLKVANPKLQTLLALGGWTFGSERFSWMARDGGIRANFVRSAVQFLRRHGFDGLDLDWEFPAQRGGVAEDKEAFVLLCRELRQAIDSEVRSIGIAPLLLTAAVSANPEYVDAGYDVPQLAELIDLFHIMAYDYHGGWETSIGHHSPLYRWPGYTDNNKFFNVNDSCHFWVSRGLPESKLVVGVALYGRSFTLLDPSRYGIGAPASSGPAGPITGTPGFLAYYEICRLLSSGVKHHLFDDVQQIPYLVSGTTWVGYDDVNSVKIKVEWLKREGFAGVMFWSIDFDDFTGEICPTTEKAYPLLSVAAHLLKSDNPISYPPSSLPTTSSPPTIPLTTERPTPSPPTIPLTTEIPTLSPPTILLATERPTPSPPTTTKRSTPSASTTNLTTQNLTEWTTASGFPCRFWQFKADPTSCSHFIRCVHGKVLRFRCPGVLHWNAQVSSCDWPSVSQCVP